MFNVQHASGKDIPLIKNLADEVWPQTYSSILTPQQTDYMMELMYSEPSLQKQMEKGHRFLLLLDDEHPVGFASYSAIEPALFKLHKIYVLAPMQGRGAGKFFMKYIIGEIQKKGAGILRLNVNRHNKARSFYDKLGFQLVGEEDVDIGNGYFMNDYIMEKDLNKNTNS